MSQKGLIFIPVLIGILSIVAVAGFIYVEQKIVAELPDGERKEATFSAGLDISQSFGNLLNLNQSYPTPTPTSNKSTNNQSTPTPSPTSTFSTKTSTPTPTPTPSTSSTTSNPYDLNSATGAVKVMVKPQSGNLAYIPQAELAAVSGFKVLDGRSTDKITQFGKDRTDELRGEIIFSTAPPGPYKVRISYNGSWSDQKDVTVSSGQQSYVEFTVAGVVPTPTPIPKPICSVLANPSTGNAPYQSNICIGNNSNPYQYIQQELTDYDGNGSWDYQGSFWGCHSYTFQTPGTYYPKAKIVSTSGVESDICQTSVTVY